MLLGTARCLQESSKEVIRKQGGNREKRSIRSRDRPTEVAGFM
jgi:hypothetical protein